MLCEFSNLPSPVRSASKCLTTHSFFSISNPSTSVLTAPLTLIATVPNYICSKLITKDLIANLPAATDYTILLTDVLNTTNVRALSLHYPLL